MTTEDVADDDVVDDDVICQTLIVDYKQVSISSIFLGAWALSTL